jgi:hypothetical protein
MALALWLRDDTPAKKRTGSISDVASEETWRAGHRAVLSISGRGKRRYAARCGKRYRFDALFVMHKPPGS